MESIVRHNASQAEHSAKESGELEAAADDLFAMLSDLADFVGAGVGRAGESGVQESGAETAISVRSLEM